MATHYNFWLEYLGDPRTLRDFLFDACKCTRFWVASNKYQEGRPDNQKRKLYAIANDYNLISLGGKLESSSYKNDLHVFFTYNGESYAQWEQEVINACVAWLARTTGDALLDLDGLPILGRHGRGVIIVNDLAKAYAGRRMKAELIKRSQACIAEALDRECLESEIGQPEPL